MQPEASKAIGGAESPGGEGADAAGSMIAAESAPCEVLVGEGPCWTTAVTAAGASVEAAPPSEGAVNRRESGVCGWKQNSAAGTAIDGGDYRR